MSKPVAGDAPLSEADGAGADDALDLSPRVEVGAESRSSRSGLRHWLPRLVLVVIALLLAFVLFRTLSSARLFFYNVDAAVQERSALEDRRFQIQGTPYTSATELVAAGEASVGFSIRFDDVEADVVHIGAPAELFQPGVPVVLEGQWVPNDEGIDFVDGADDGYYFESTRMLVKHDNEYRVDNPERLAEAEQGGGVTP